jgi:AraC-like DNA-binding protein
VIIDKPDYEYHMRPAAGELTIFNFTNEFYRQYIEDCNLKQAFFFSNPNILSLMLGATAEMDYLHFQIMKRSGGAGRLEMDNLIMEMFSQIIALITNESAGSSFRSSAKPLHLRPVEMAKEYIHENFASDISLYEVSDHCCVSPFHFSRIFKKFTSYSPHQYLHNVRLKHGESLLRTTSHLVSDVAFSSGFNSVEYFATAFRQRYKMSPSKYRGER